MWYNYRTNTSWSFTREQPPHCNKATGWSVKNWIKASKSSKSFDSYKIYIIKCTNSSESFIKIGRTFQKTKQRFSSKTRMPYNIEIIKEIIL